MKNAINRYSLAELQTFIVLAQELNFAQAGKVLNLSSSSVSRQIANLESAIGVSLFTRSTRKVALTDAGDALYQEALPILSELSGLTERLQSMRHDIYGRVLIAAPRWYASHYLAPVLPAIRQQHPGLKIEVLSSDELVDPIESGVDILIRFNGITQPDIVARALMKYEYWLVASPQFVQRRGALNRPSDLAEEDILAYRFSQPHNQWMFRKSSRVHKVNVAQASVVSNNPEVLLQAALSDGGLALLPNIGVHSFINSGELVRLMPDYEITPNRFENAIYLVYTKDKARLARVKAVLDILKSSLMEKADTDQ